MSRFRAILAPEPVERIDTHAAVILLAGKRAFKLKRPVRFSFLDFRSLDAREQALRAELELNRRTAPQIYLALRRLTLDGDRLVIDGDGETVDWALEMRRFDRSMELDRLAAAGRLDDEILGKLAKAIERFHKELPPLGDKGGHAAMLEVVEGNADDLRSVVPKVLDAAEIEPVIAASAAELARQASLLDCRRDLGWVRHCHGDLHLGNIVMIDGEPVLFDCIEFNDDFACIDLLYDAAFLLMDLMRRDMQPAAQRLLQRYHEDMAAGLDEAAVRALDEGLALLPLFIATRAVIRGKIAGFAGDGETARAYLDLAGRALAPPPPMLIAIGGRSGTGKSTIGAALAPRHGAMPGAMVLRSDVIRKQLFGKAPLERLPQEAYAPEVSQKVFRRMAERAEVLLRAGRTVILDAVFGAPGHCAMMREVAARLEVPLAGFWLTAPEAVLESRVAARQGDASDADVEVVRRQRELACGDPDWRALDASGAPDEVAALVERALPCVAKG